MIAWTNEQTQKLPSIVEKAHAIGVADVTRISLDELRWREPNLSPAAKGAVHIPGEGFIDPWSIPLAYVHQAKVFALATAPKFQNNFYHNKLEKNLIFSLDIVFSWLYV